MENNGRWSMVHSLIVHSTTNNQPQIIDNVKYIYNVVYIVHCALSMPHFTKFSLFCDDTGKIVVNLGDFILEHIQNIIEYYKMIGWVFYLGFSFSLSINMQHLPIVRIFEPICKPIRLIKTSNANVATKHLPLNLIWINIWNRLVSVMRMILMEQLAHQIH